MYEYLAPDGELYTADIETLEQWARNGRIPEGAVLVHKDTRVAITAGEMEPLRRYFADRPAAAGLSLHTSDKPSDESTGSADTDRKPARRVRKLLMITLGGILALGIISIWLTRVGLPPAATQHFEASIGR